MIMKRFLIRLVTALFILQLLTACTANAPPSVETSAPVATDAPVDELSPPTDLPLAPTEYTATVTDTVSGREFSPLPTAEGDCFYLSGVNDPTGLFFNCWLGEQVSATVLEQTVTQSVRFSLDLTTPQTVQITYHPEGQPSVTRQYTFVISSANILNLTVDETRGSIHAMNSDRNHETYCYGSLAYLSSEKGGDFSSFFSIKGRGNATWEDEKKGYALKLYQSEECTDKNKISVSGMGKSANWVLVANHRDRSLIRNALAQTLAAKLEMRYSVKFVFVDLYMNGEHLGLYNLMQKVEIGKEQVDIPKASEDDLSGGYLLEFDNYTDTPQIRLKKSKLNVTINEPDQLGSYTAIEKRLNEAEVAIFDPKGYNKDTGLYWYDYIDTRSFATLWILREYAMDNDATVNFRFYFDPADQKFHGGPAWDFDNSFARNSGVFADPEFGLIESGHRNERCWLRMLMEFDGFRDEIIRIYRENASLFDTESPDSIYALAGMLREQLSYSIRQNFEVWDRQLTYPAWNMPPETTYEGHFKIVTDFLERRNAFWKEYIPALKQY